MGGGEGEGGGQGKTKSMLVLSRYAMGEDTRVRRCCLGSPV